MDATNILKYFVMVGHEENQGQKQIMELLIFIGLCI
jgi:hypothetical protein